MSLMFVGMAAFAFIFLKAFQQRNIAFNQYAWVMPCSLALAAVEVFVIAQVVMSGWQWAIVLAIGFGAGCGAIFAMLLHNRMFPRGK